MYCDQTPTKFPVTRLPGLMSNHRWRMSDESQNPDWGTCGLKVQTAPPKRLYCTMYTTCLCRLYYVVMCLYIVTGRSIAVHIVVQEKKDSRYLHRRLLVDITSVGLQLLARQGCRLQYPPLLRSWVAGILGSVRGLAQVHVCSLKQSPITPCSALHILNPPTVF